jgi:Phasin protein
MAAMGTSTDRPFPGLDLEGIAAAQRRYLDAWAGASQIMLDAMRTVIQRQAEMAQNGMREFWSERETGVRSRPGEYRPTEPLERLQAVCERAFSDYQELGDIVLRAQSEALQLLGDGAKASLEDMRRAA